MSEVTREEFNMLRETVTTNAARLDAIDSGGTRGVAVVQVQLTDLVKDVAGLNTRMDRHEREHVDDQKARAASRRWAVTTAIGALAAVEAPLLWIVTHLHG